MEVAFLAQRRSREEPHEQRVCDVADLPDLSVQRDARAVEDVRIRFQSLGVRFPRIFRAFVVPGLAGRQSCGFVVDDLEEEGLVDPVFGGRARVYAVAHYGVAPGAAPELVPDVLYCGLEEVDSGAGAGDAV